MVGVRVSLKLEKDKNKQKKPQELVWKFTKKHMKIHWKQKTIFHDCVATCQNISHMQHAYPKKQSI